MASYHRQIFEALAEEINRAEFEPCACDLLRSIFPGIFPIHGGSDSGQDGGIADGLGEPFPLVCTTGKDVIGNLTRSLTKYKKSGGGRRKVVVATSQELSGKRQENLKKRARREGFELVGVYDRHWMRDSLLRSPRWCLKLLGLTGTPSALSPVPKSNRSHPEIARVGRDADLEWLRWASGNRLLIGQPGSGKTFLLRCLVREARALFLVDSDRTAIANALREERPEIVIVDDAHRDPRVLEMLHHLQEDLQAEQGAPDFSILATCWPGQKEQIASALGLFADEQVRHLELMTRKEILAVLHQLLSGPGQLLQWLVDQADNKPGLAVTLAWLCLRGDWQRVVEGEALRMILMPIFEELVGPKASDVLGFLSLGGDAGATPGLAGRLLGLDRTEVRSLAIGLAAGGVLEEGKEERLLVWPQALRTALIRKTFFDRPAPLPWREFLDQLPDRDASLREIIRATHRGTSIPPHELRQLAEGTRDEFVWRGMAAHTDHTLWALENAPLNIGIIAAEALETMPEAALPGLLAQASKEPEPVNSLPAPALRVLQDWLLEPLADSRRILARRRLALEHSERFFDRGGRRSIAVQAACLAFTPEVRGHDIDPLELASITRSGTLPVCQLRDLEGLWPILRNMLDELDAPLWFHLNEMLRKWRSLLRDRSDETQVAARSFIHGVLEDMAQLAEESPGLACALQQVGDQTGLKLDICDDPVLGLLYPKAPDSIDDLKGFEDRQRAGVCDLAREWGARRSAPVIARELNRYHREARFMQRRAYSKWPQELCHCLAENGLVGTDVLLTAFLDGEAPVQQVAVVLSAICESRPEGWEALVARCFTHEAFAGAATTTVLTLPDAPEDLLASALDGAPSYLSEISAAILCGDIPPSILSRLLSHPDPVVATESVLAEWWAEPRDSFRDELEAICHEAVLRSATEEDPDRRLTVGRIGDVLEGNPELAFRWLRRRLRQVESATSWLVGVDAALQAVSALRKQDRQTLLRELRPGPPAFHLLTQLVDRDLELYRELLTIERLAQYYPLPLKGIPDEAWASLASLALDHGFSTAEVADSCLRSGHTIMGYGQDYWQRWDAAFMSLESHADSRLREIARLGRRRARSEIQEADAREHADALYGIGQFRKRRPQVG